MLGTHTLNIALFQVFGRVNIPAMGMHVRQETLRRRVELARASRTSVEMSGGFDADLGGGK